MRWKVILDYLDGPNVITEFLRSGRGRQSIGGMKTLKVFGPLLFEDGGMGPLPKELARLASRGWERQERLYPGDYIPKEMQPC